MFSKLAFQNVRRSLKDYSVYFLTLTFGVCIFYVFNSMEFCQADIHALFQMTPYYWKTPKAGAARLAALDTLTARISFRIHIFQKS